MNSYRIALIPGDGVGIEISDEAEKVLDAAAESFDWSCDRYLATGEMMPENALDTLSAFDSIFLGCIGDADKVEDHIQAAIAATLSAGKTRTKDMGRTSSTIDMGSAVVAAMRATA